jgi:hypothetical protein
LRHDTASLEWPEGQDQAILNLWVGGKEKGELVEIRGHRLIGSKYEGDRLDRILGAIPRIVNMSEPMTGAEGEKVH